MSDLRRIAANLTQAGKWRQGSVETDAIFVPDANALGPERVILRMNKHYANAEADCAAIVELVNSSIALSAIVDAVSRYDVADTAAALALDRREYGSHRRHKEERAVALVDMVAALRKLEARKEDA